MHDFKGALARALERLDDQRDGLKYADEKTRNECARLQQMEDDEIALAVLILRAKEFKLE